MCEEYFGATPGCLETINKYSSTVQAIREFSISFNIMNSVNFYYLYFVAIKGIPINVRMANKALNRSQVVHESTDTPLKASQAFTR